MFHASELVTVLSKHVCQKCKAVNVVYVAATVADKRQHCEGHVRVDCALTGDTSVDRQRIIQTTCFPDAPLLVSACQSVSRDSTKPALTPAIFFEQPPLEQAGRAAEENNELSGGVCTVTLPVARVMPRVSDAISNDNNTLTTSKQQPIPRNQARSSINSSISSTIDSSEVTAPTVVATVSSDVNVEQCHQLSNIIVRKELSETDLTCPKCPRKAKDKRSLITHIRHMHEKKHKCGECNFAFSRPSELRVHRDRIHLKIVKEKAYFCDECGRGFTEMYLLTLHQWNHIDSEPFRCSQCPKHFKFRSSLRDHARRHESLRQFTCDCCGRQAKTKDDLEEHVSIHTGAKPHRCGICGQTFRVNVMLQNHRRKYQHLE